MTEITRWFGWLMKMRVFVCVFEGVFSVCDEMMRVKLVWGWVI